MCLKPLYIKFAMGFYKGNEIILDFLCKWCVASLKGIENTCVLTSFETMDFYELPLQLKLR